MHYSSPNLPTRRRTWLRIAVALLLLLNLHDAIITLALVQSGLAVEANPLMDVPLVGGAIWFMFTKIALVSLGVWLLWRYRHRRSAVLALGSATLVYSLVAIYHLKSVSELSRFLADATFIANG